MKPSPFEKVEYLLAAIRTDKTALAECQALAEQEMRQVKARHATNIEHLAAQIADLEKLLEREVKKHSRQILGGRDRADLPSGSVMLKVEKRVRQVKGMLARLKAAGLSVAIRVVKETVDWDAVEKFDDGLLSALGTERKQIERFSYELRSSKNG